MMARSTTRSNQRPDTLMQDRICQVDETSCNARPDHTLGSKAPFWQSAGHFRSTPIIGRLRCRPPLRKSATSRPGQCAHLQKSDPRKAVKATELGVRYVWERTPRGSDHSVL